jgi:predicted acyltransferase
MTLRGAGAVLAGFVTVFVLSIGTDQVLHVLKVYPPWGQPMSNPLFLLATAYRIVYTVLGGYITARLAPHAPMRHVLVLGIVGLVFGAVGIVVAITHPELGPLWYPVVIALTALPCAWIGGLLHRAQRPGQ